MELEGKRVIVTGAFGALGGAVASRLADAGARIAALDRAEARDEPRVAFARGGVELADEAAARDAIDAAATALGGLDGLVNIAGGFRWETIADGSLATWESMFRMNLATAVAASMAAIPHLRANRSGRIVNIGAAAAAKAGSGMGAYTASKSGVARLTEALADELKADAITVNAVLPSILDTPQNRADMPDADFAAWVQPAQLADVIAFLLSDRADAITGALLPVTGRV